MSLSISAVTRTTRCVSRSSWRSVGLHRIARSNKCDINKSISLSNCSSTRSYSSASTLPTQSTLSNATRRRNCLTVPSQFPFSGFFTRSFSGSPSREAKTIQQIQSRYRIGPLSWKGGLLFICTGAAMVFYFRFEKARLERKRITEMSKGVGKPKVGGPFLLKDLDGNAFTEEDLKGKYNFVRCQLSAVTLIVLADRKEFLGEIADRLD
jgi:hypothetical protein